MSRNRSLNPWAEDISRYNEMAARQQAPSPPPAQSYQVHGRPPPVPNGQPQPAQPQQWRAQPPQQQPSRTTPGQAVSPLDISRPGYSELAYSDIITQLKNMQGRSADAYNRLFDAYNTRERPTENFAGYYDQAASNLARDIDSAYAARGNFRGTAATNTLARAAADLRAQQAREQAGFALAAAEQERRWADALVDAAARGDANEYQRIAGQLAAARQADEAKLGRVGMGYDAIMRLAGALAGIASPHYDALLRGDQDLVTDEELARLGMTREQLAGENRQANQLTTNIADILALLAKPSPQGDAVAAR